MSLSKAVCTALLTVVATAGPVLAGPCRGVSGVVRDAASGRPVAGAQVVLRDQERRTDAGGGFCFDRSDALRRQDFHLSEVNGLGEVVACSVFSVEVRYAPLVAVHGDRIGMTIVEPGTSQTTVLPIHAVAPPTVDRYCVGCHRWNPCFSPGSKVSRAQARRHLRGPLVPQERVAELKEELRRDSLRAESYRRIRYTDTHANSMNMARISRENAAGYRLPRGLALLEDGRTSCDTCHTRHLPTGHGAFAVKAYRNGQELCAECHR